MSERDRKELLSELGLTEYEREALDGLLRLGRTSAPKLSESTGIPKARIYDVLDELADRGFVKVIPGRPKLYDPRSPSDILERADRNRRQEYEQYSHRLEELAGEFEETYGPLYQAAGEETTPSEELFHVVDVGEPSLRETRRLYDEAGEEIDVVTKSFEYFPEVEPAFEDALERGVDVRVLFLHPGHLTDENAEIQTETREHLQENYPSVETRFSEKRLPLRGTLVDPSMDYTTGQATFLVEEKDIPVGMRQAAVTENGPLVAGMMRYFDLIWEYESVAESPTEP